MGKIKFKDLSESDVDFIKKLYTSPYKTLEEKTDTLKVKFGISERTTRRWFVKLGCKVKEDKLPSQYEEAVNKKIQKKSNFIITWGQNDTPIHRTFFNNVLAYKDYLNAELLVIAGRYKNPTSIFDSGEDTWDDNILPYLSANRHDIHNHLTVMSDVKIQPTAVNPLNGMESMSKDTSCIFGHPKLHMKTLPILDGYQPKQLFTTGSCTIENYTDSKAGKKGEFYHCLGFVIVNIVDDTYHIRQVHADIEGNFYDLEVRVKNGVVFPNYEISSIVMGDLHSRFIDEECLEASLDFIQEFDIPNVVLHDVIDNYSVNHHIKKNPFEKYKRCFTYGDYIGNELSEAAFIVRQFADIETVDKVYIVKSNHDEWLEKWLVETDWKTEDPSNYSTYLELSLDFLNQVHEGKVIGVFPSQLLKRMDKNSEKIVPLDRSTSVKLVGHEISQHGDMGTKGSPGSLNSFRKLNTKIIVGHTHTPLRFDGVCYVGTTTPVRLDYNKGLSDWLQTHVIIYPDGKVQHINYNPITKSFYGRV
jgi:hypothetical protein